jgi:signal peptidase I
VVKEKQIQETTGGIFWEVIKTVGGILLFLIIFRFYLFQPYTISGSSMEPNFHDGEYIVVNELSYNLGKPKRGDAVVFKHPDPSCTDFVNKGYINRIFFQGPCSNYIKRVIGLPGETVSIKDGKITVKNKENPNGFVLNEKYIVPNVRTYGNQEVTLANDEYYVLGDNRNPNASSDSREWGPLPRKYMVGKAMVILLPANSFEVVKTPTY